MKLSHGTDPKHHLLRQLRRWMLSLATATGAALAALALCLSPQPAYAAPLQADAAAALDWAEFSYPSLFPGVQRTLSAPPYTYRYYPDSGNYLGVAGGSVWLLGPAAGGGALPSYIGELSDFACSIYPANCQSSSAWPERSIMLVVPFAAGGPTDKIARDLAEALGRQLGRSVVVSNLTGQAGTTANAAVAAAAPDGYTLLLNNTTFASTATVYRNLPYTLANFDFVGLVNEMPFILSGRPGLAPKDFASLLSLIKANPGKVRMAHAGYGSLPYLCLAWLQQQLGVSLQGIAYTGTAPALNDLLGDLVDLMCADSVSLLPQIEAKRIQSYAVTSTRRIALPAAAELRTLAELGKPGLVLTAWSGLFAPKGTPALVLERLNVALRGAVNDPVFISRQAGTGAQSIQDNRASSAGLSSFSAQQVQTLGTALRAAGNYAD